MKRAGDRGKVDDFIIMTIKKASDMQQLLIKNNDELVNWLKAVLGLS